MTSVKLTDCTLHPFQAPDPPGSDAPCKFRNFLVLELVPSAEPVPAACPDILGRERGSLKGSWVSPPGLPWAFLWWFLSLLLRTFGLLVLGSQELVQLSRTSLLLLRGWILVLLKVFSRLLLLCSAVDPAFLVPPPRGPGDGAGPMRSLGSYILHSSVPTS